MDINTLTDEIIAAAREYASNPEIEANTSLSDIRIMEMPFDELDFISLIMTVETQLGIELPESNYGDTPAEMARNILPLLA